MPFWYTPKCKMMVLFLIAIAVTSLIYYPILAIAKNKNIVDNPEARKLQKNPIPVLGGLAVFFGIVFSLCYFKTTISHTTLFPVLGVMVIMLYLGSIDDILQISPILRLVVEFIAGCLLVYGSRYAIMNFQGALGWGELSPFFAVPLTLLAFVGIINAINLIDGIDGLLSSFGLYACACLGIMCFLVHDYSYAALAAVTGGALVPFLFHNVFGKETKMFMGDGGSLMIGTVLAALVFTLLRKGAADNIADYISADFSMVAFTLSVLSVPVFDTLRVMMVRIIHHRSPFSADNNHLHHLLLSINPSHRAAVLYEILLAIAATLIFILSFALGASTTVQLLVSVSSGIAVTLGASVILNKRKGSMQLDDKRSADSSRESFFSDGIIYKLIQRNRR